MSFYFLRELLFPLSIFFILYILIKKFSFAFFYSFFAFLVILFSLSYLVNKSSETIFSPPPGGDSGTSAVRKITNDITEYKNNLAQNYNSK